MHPPASQAAGACALASWAAWRTGTTAVEASTRAPDPRTRNVAPPNHPLSQGTLNQCTAAKSAATGAYVSCQNQLIDLQQANETSASAAGEARALLGDCEARLQEALARLMPPV